VVGNPGNKAVVLLSGGLDSTTVLALALRDGFDVAALTFDYGQRHALELRAARDLAERSGLRRHAVVSIDLRAYGGSALTDDIRVPKGRSDSEIGGGVPVTYVPARNTIFLAHALALAEVEGAQDIFIGVNTLDYSGYPDCRPQFIEAFQTMANLATKAATENIGAIEIRTPLMKMTKAEIIDLGISLGVDYAHTLSCYDPVAEEGEHGRAAGLPRHCGSCDACLLRKKGFTEAGIPDPTPYAE